jgi:hypothetical protein
MFTTHILANCHYLAKFKLNARGGIAMSHLSFWVLICLLGWASLQATDVPIDSSEAHCRGRPQIDLEDDLVAYEPMFAFIYNNNAGTKQIGTNGYKVKSPIIFNSQGPRLKIEYDQNTGELIIPTSGDYEITYSCAPYQLSPFGTEAEPKINDAMALAINGKTLALSQRSKLSRFDVATATIVLPLLKGDRVSLVFPNIKHSSLFRNTVYPVPGAGIGNSASLFIKKL